MDGKKMSGLRKAAEMALEALENYKQGNSEPAKALRQALAQPEQEPVDVVKVEHDKQVELAQAYERGWNAALAHGQEPVAWMSDHDVDFKKSSFGTYPCVPLYTAPPKREWVGLTDEESIKLLQKAAKHKSPDYCTAPEMAVEFGRLASEALKEKNT